MRQTIYGILFMTFALPLDCDAQWGAEKKINPFHKAYHDSLKTMSYDYKLPLLGKNAYRKGYDIPFAYGASLVFFTQRQDIEISSVMIGLNDREMADVSNIIQFGDIESQAYASTFRPDVWILPFLNLYTIFGVGKSTTSVSLIKPFLFQTDQNFHAKSFGVGATIAGSVGPLIVILDNNYNWADVEAFVEPVPAYNFDARLGHNFVSPRRADRSLTIWFGTFYQKIQADTDGKIPVSNLFPELTEQEQQEVMHDLNVWYDGLSIPGKVIVREIVDKIQGFFDGSIANAEIHYKLDKRIADPWNLIFGAQFQYNKHWQLRAEIGTFGRQQFLLNLNYRIAGFNKK